MLAVGRAISGSIVFFFARWENIRRYEAAFHFLLASNKFLPTKLYTPFFDRRGQLFGAQKNFPATENYNYSKIREIIAKVHMLFSRPLEEY